MSRKLRLRGPIAYALFLLLCSELALQVFYRATAGAWLPERAAVPIWATNPWSGVFNKPDLAYRHRTSEFDAFNYTNSQGFRVAKGAGSYALDPPPDTTRIMLLGPSFAFGWGVDYEATLAHVLEHRLEAAGFRGGRRVQLINAGVPSLPPAAQLNWFRHVGREFHPEVVVQLIHGSMAVDNQPRSPKSATPEGYLIRPNATPLDHLRAQVKKSALVFYGWIVYAELDRKVSGSTGGEVMGAGRELQLHGSFSIEDPEVAEALGHYRALRDAIREAGAEALVVYFPLSYAVHPEDESRWRHLGVEDIEGQLAFDRAFCEHLAAHEGLPCLDITPELREAALRSGERLYYWLDVHWTEAGNRVAAEAVAARLLDGREERGEAPEGPEDGSG